MLKKIVIIVSILWASSSELNAQHEIKINALGLLYSNYGIAYEYGFGGKFGVNIFGSYFSTPVFLQKILDLRYTSKEINSEFRIYLNNTNNSSGFYAGPYIKYIKRKYSGIPFVETSDSIQINITDINVQKLALGVITGYKGIISNNLIIGGYLGLGMNILKNRSFSNPEITEVQKNSLPQGLTYLNFRIGITVGYRFVPTSNRQYY